MFQQADCLLITKIDLAPYLEVDISQIEANVRQMNPNVTIIPVSAKTGEGLEKWFDWVQNTKAQGAIASTELERSPA